MLQGVGPGQFADAVVVAVDGLSSPTIATADLDGDGDHEIVVSAGDGLSLIDDPLGAADPTAFGIETAKGAAGQGSTLTMTYAVGGYAPGGLDKLADVVDQVISEQVRFLKAYVEKSR